MPRRSQPGAYREVIRLERAAVVARTTAFEDVTWSLLRTIRAHVRSASTSERTAAAQAVGTASFVLRSHYDGLADVTTRDRAVWGARTLGIEGPPQDPDGRRRELEIFCTEEAP